MFIDGALRGGVGSVSIDPEPVRRAGVHGRDTNNYHAMLFVHVV
jgi:hypothetical protein